ncbi:jg9470 [Pararge aegeria aegeria]|uniref:Jg9470 protein n=1 Tax=Pararge aegeria aegeria TaxID=348720 RepID=A0A8S4RJJ6_9NEOP|nr:jg9470 [Pararge aegeria aegeria]
MGTNILQITNCDSLEILFSLENKKFSCLSQKESQRHWGKWKLERDPSGADQKRRCEALRTRPRYINHIETQILTVPRGSMGHFNGRLLPRGDAIFDPIVPGRRFERLQSASSSSLRRTEWAARPIRSWAPNTTGRQLPRVPADLMERFERRPPPAGVQADAPALSRTFVTHTEQDDFLARTENVLVFAR